MTADNSVTLSLTLDPNGQAEEIFVGRYHPDFNRQINVDVTDIVKDYVKSTVPTNVDEYVQSDFSKEFLYKIEEDDGGSGTGSFTVYNIACNTTKTFAEWCGSNFLTNQPLEKTTNYEAKEWLTYLDLSKTGDWVLKARFYPKRGGHSDVVVKQDDDQGCYSVDVSFNRIVRLSNMPPAALLGYYDLILFDGNDDELCRQRYIYSERSGKEKYFLFVNALGGIDTLICEGENVLQPETTYNIGRFGRQFIPLDDTDDLRQWNQNIGMVPWRQRNWIHELLTAKQGALKFNPELGIYQAIVVTSSDISMSDNGQLASGTFGYMLDEAVNVIAENERPDRSLHASVAEQAESLHDETEQVVLAFADDGNGGYETEDEEITATKLYITDPRTVFEVNESAVYYYLNGSDTASGNFTPGVTEMPLVVTKLATDTIRFATQNAAVESLVIDYYPVTIQAV